MICDSVEAASRTLKEYTPASFDKSGSGYLRAVTPQSRPGEGWPTGAVTLPIPSASLGSRLGDPEAVPAVREA